MNLTQTNGKLYVSVFSLFFASALLLFTGCGGSRSQLKVGETAEGEVVEAEGFAAVTDDLLATKRASLSDAYKNAIEKVVGVFISGRTMVDKAITIQQTILAKTDGYIKKREVLKEWKGDDGLYHTKIRALVSYKQVQEDLKGLDLLQSPKIGHPRVAILLDETVQDSDEQYTSCSDAIAQVLLEKGYKVVDRSELAAIRVAEATKDLLAGNMDRALKPIVQKLNAEVVITGKVQAQLLTAQGLGGLISYRGSLTSKALKAQTGEILSAVSAQGSGLDAIKDAAAQKALGVIGRNAGAEYAAKILAELAKRSFVLVTVKGLPSINSLGELKETVSHVPGVSEIYMRSFSEGTAEMEVKLNSGSSGDIAGAIANTPALRAQVTGQTQDSVNVQIQ